MTAARTHGRSGRPWRRLRLLVLARDPVCTICWQAPSTTADHVIPLSVRPDLAHVPSNLRGSCGPCNYSRGASLGNAQRQSAHARPAAVVPAGPAFTSAEW